MSKFISLLLASLTYPTQACECPEFNIQQLEKNSAAIVIGQLVDAKFLKSEQISLANFYVHQSVKGQVFPTEQVFVETHSQDNPCGLKLTVEKIYALFIDENDFVNSCSSFNLQELDKYQNRRQQLNQLINRKLK